MPMLITAFAYWGVGMPVGAWLAFGAGHGVRGMWVGLIAGLTAAAALLFARWVRQTRGDNWRHFSLTPLEAAVVESQGMEARSGLDELGIVRQSDVPSRRQSGTIARQSPRRGHGHVPLATAAVAAVRMRMTGCQARAQEVAKEVHGPSPLQSSAAAPREERAGRA